MVCYFLAFSSYFAGFKIHSSHKMIDQYQYLNFISINLKVYVKDNKY